MGKHSGALPLSQTKVQTRINGIKERSEPCCKEKQATLVGVRWLEAIQYDGVDVGDGWMSNEHTRTRKTTQPKKKNSQQNNASLDESVGDPEILKGDKDVC